jgi:N-methylhydantoinase A
MGEGGRDAIGVYVGFDIGGTFTDILICTSDGDVRSFKVLSTSEHIARRVGECIREVLHRRSEARVARMVHATTVASNALIEGKLARTGYVTTVGFRDDIDFPRPRYQRSTDTISFGFPPPTPLIPRSRRFEVAERIGGDGAVKVGLDVGAVEEALSRLNGLGIEALAVCLVNSYANPVHEREIVQRALALNPSLEVVASHEVSPEAGEYERAATTALHASLTPVIKDYLADLEEDLRAFPGVVIMQSNGGVVPAERARRRPANLVESGPAAGVLAAGALARELGIEKAVALDMGGTTVKVCLIEEGRPRETVQMEVSLDAPSRLVRGSGHALRTAGFDLVEIGAGGGSIAWIDRGGALRVGPRSAGAVPGPACYGLGGREPTITDAAVVLGYLNPTTIAGGTVAIRPDLAEKAVDEYVATQAEMTTLDAAYGICRVAVASMRRAVHTVTTQRGCDPRGCTLIAFGGAGPVFAAWLADDLEIRRVYVPEHAGLFSVVGLLTADMRFDFATPVLTSNRLEGMDATDLLERYDRMRTAAVDDLEKSNVNVSAAVIERSIDLRYVRQASELNVALPEAVGPDDLNGLLSRSFHDAHEQQFGYCRSEESLVISTLRLRVSIPNNDVRLAGLRQKLSGEEASSSVRRRGVVFGMGSNEESTRIYSRASMTGGVVAGPAIVEEPDTTVLVPPGWRAGLERIGTIMLERS